MKQEYKTLDVGAVQFDTENPRIKKALEKYGDRINAERISFALRSADSGTTTSSFDQLKDSIHANKGIIQPITVMHRNGEYVCIDGNTRLAIYKDFARDGVGDIWNEIRALVLESPSKRDVEQIRMAAHLVGPREWPAYEKARYLNYLYHEEFLEYSEMVSLCGGNQRDIQNQIEAFDDMNQYYRDISTEDEFKIDRFSGFVELQKSRIKEAIFDAGFELQDFGKWIKNGNIFRLADVRKLPKVLKDEDARSVFINGGVDSIEGAIKLADQNIEKTMQINQNEVNVEDASIEVLARALAKKIDNMPFSHLQFLQSEEDGAAEQVGALESLVDSASQLISNVRK